MNGKSQNFTQNPRGVEREKLRAEALRQNLLKRKAQQSARKETDDKTESAQCQ